MCLLDLVLAQMKLHFRLVKFQLEFLKFLLQILVLLMNWVEVRLDLREGLLVVLTLLEQFGLGFCLELLFLLQSFGHFLLKTFSGFLQAFPLGYKRVVFTSKFANLGFKPV